MKHDQSQWNSEMTRLVVKKRVIKVTPLPSSTGLSQFHELRKMEENRDLISVQSKMKNKLIEIFIHNFFFINK
jgi:hypothetical protein